MRRYSLPVLLLLLALFPYFSCKGHTGLTVTFNEHGLERLSYDGLVLADTTAHPSDAFRIGHMKCTDAHGVPITSGQFGWGENNNGRSWDPVTRSWHYRFSWGSIRVQYIPGKDRLDIKVTESNNSDSNVTFDGATIYPLVLHFPVLPHGFQDHSYRQLAFNTKGPSVTVADYGQGEVVSAVPDPAKPLYSGFEPAEGAGSAWVPIVSGTSLDNMATFYPLFDRPVPPGGTDTFEISLRFAPSGTTPSTVAGDVYAAWDRARPAQLNWPDRRIIGTVYLASAPQSTSAQSFPNNPRRYFNDSDPKHLDVRTPDGLVNLQKRVLKQAQEIVKNLARLNAQGVITWDIEGEQFPHSTTYLCAPDQIAQVAPEMESVIDDSSSPFEGMKLDDAYFKIIRDAGFRSGVCVRPQHFTLDSDDDPKQVYLPDSEVEQELARKIRFANSRWGATLFYLDSTTDHAGGVLSPEIFAHLAAAFPDCLLIPEESSPADYAYAAAFKSFLFHSEYGTSDAVYGFYPKAFSAILLNDVDPQRLNSFRQQLTRSVHRGDILMVHADYWHENNTTALQIYQAAAMRVSSPK